MGKAVVAVILNGRITYMDNEREIAINEAEREMHARIAAMLITGISIEQVALAYGVTAEYLKELTETDEGLKEAMQSAANSDIGRLAKQQTTYDSLEDKLLSKIEARSNIADFRELGQVLKIIHELNPSNKRREKEARLEEAVVRDKRVLEAQAELANAVGRGIGQVTLALPAFAAQAIQVMTNARKEIMSIEGRDLSPMSYESFQSIVEERNRNDMNNGSNLSNKGVV